MFLQRNFRENLNAKSGED